MAGADIPVETRAAAEARRLPARRRAVGRAAAATPAATIVLMGHRDTVFPEGEVARRPFTHRDGVAYGPGVADMKAGLVMNCFVLAAFSKFGGAPGPLRRPVHRRRGDRQPGGPRR